MTALVALLDAIADGRLPSIPPRQAADGVRRAAATRPANLADYTADGALRFAKGSP
ncbi:MAG: hypothetical protein M3Q55_15285 [Acidobacteriota bacterium]|nr:hypothetical protein [Acidobacteriota bacterium]